MCTFSTPGARQGGGGEAVQDGPAQLCRLHPGPQDAQGVHQGALHQTRAGGHRECCFIV